jgi:hypothetical protein
MALSKKTSLSIAAGIVVLGVVAYFLWMRPDAEESVTVSGTGPSSQAQATFLTLAAQLEPISFDASALSDPRFTSLVDIKTVIVPEAEGRTDPFSALPGVPVTD